MAEELDALELPSRASRELEEVLRCRALEDDKLWLLLEALWVGKLFEESIRLPLSVTFCKLHFATMIDACPPPR